MRQSKQRSRKRKFKKCIVHQIRNSIRFVGYKDLKTVTADLKPFCKASTEDLAMEALSEFDEKWGKNTRLLRKV
ncbi:hypothetical protein D347_01391 [Enterococcus faecalis LA3B-2]|nr:hypothetical protein D347_01391 [Enterococcus faecalis LA3B-2]HER4726213.1 transposase [Streptococcus pyogenes NGAS319]